MATCPTSDDERSRIRTEALLLELRAASVGPALEIRHAKRIATALAAHLSVAERRRRNRPVVDPPPIVSSNA
jgi:hypothetical protein